MKAEPVVELRFPIRVLSADDLVRLHLAEVFAYVSRRLPLRQDAEDVTAETFQAACQSLGKMKGQDPKLWLLGIARRKVVDAYRRKHRRREKPLDLNLVDESSMQSELEHSDQVEAMRQIVMALPEDQREALLLQHLEGLTIAEIATVMGRSHAAINSLLQRARVRAFEKGKGLFHEELP